MKEHVVVDPLNNDLPANRQVTAGRLYYYIRNGHALYWASFFALILIEFFLGGAMSRILSRENYFRYINVLNNIPFYNVLVNAGLSYGIVYIIAHNTNIRFAVFRQVLQIQGVVYSAVAALHLVLFVFFREVFPVSLLITAIISIAYVSRQNITSFFLATRLYNKAAIANMLQKIVLLLLFLGIYLSTPLRAALNQQFQWLYPAIELSVVLVYLLAFRQSIGNTLRAQGIRYRRRIMRYSKYALFNNALNVLYYTILVFIIRSSAIDLHVKILFGLCIMFFRYTGAAIAPVFSIMNPQVTGIKNDPVKVARKYREYFVVVLIASLLTMAACRFFFGFFIRQFYASAYHDLPGYFYFFCYMVPLLFLTSLNGSFLAALGRIKYTFNVEVVCTLVLLGFFAYNLYLPIAYYGVFYYIVLVHLAIKFLLLTYGSVKAVKQ